MEFPRTARTELVISMTLAETFLLLLFVVWFSVAKDGGPDDPSVLKIMVAELQKKVDSLNTELAEEKNKNQDLKERLDFWAKNFGMGIPGTMEEVRQLCREAGRGHPKCQENNVLVQVAVVRGQTKMEVVAKSAALAQFLAASGISTPTVGTVTADPRAVETFLAGVSDFYKARSAANTECRFDYRLTYATKEDYFDGRELFEKYFYAARINQVGIGSK